MNEGPIFMSNPLDEALLAPKPSASPGGAITQEEPEEAQRRRPSSSSLIVRQLVVDDDEEEAAAAPACDEATPQRTTVATELNGDEQQEQPPSPDGPVFLQAIHAPPSRTPFDDIGDDVDRDALQVNVFGTSSQQGITVTQKEEGKEADKNEVEDQQEEEVTTASMAWRRHIKSCLHRRDDEQAQQLLYTYQRLVGGKSRRGGSSPTSSSFTTNGDAIRELILLSGPSGSGKTRLARTLHDPVVRAGGYFLAGKFDKLNLCSNAPYTAFGAAFGDFAANVQSRGDDEFHQVRHSIHSALGAEAAVLTRMIPGLEPLCGCGECPLISAARADPSNKAQQAKAAAVTAAAIQRFVFVFRTFLRTVATPDRPIVLLLDDIHFADQCSLSLLTSIVTDEHNTGLIVVCTVDDRPDSHPPYLGGKLRDIEDDGTTIQQIVVPNLSEDQVCQMLRQALNLPTPEVNAEETKSDRYSSERGGVRSLSDIVMHQTRGNPADVIEFLCWLRESDLLYMDTDAGTWSWDIDEIDMTINTRQVGDFVTDKLEQLPVEVKDVLKVSACLGSQLNVQLLEYVLSTDVRPSLKSALATGAIQYDSARREYYFEHDGVQSAAYSLIPEGDRELFHLEVGRRMWRKLDEPAVDRYVFTLLLQFNMGRRLITRERERVSVAMLCLHAGIKAARSSTFRTAVIYLDLGLSLLDDSSWRQHYDLALALHNAGAEMHMCMSNFERSAELVETVLANAKIMADKVQAYATRIYALGAMDRKKEAIEKGFEVLALMGEPMPTNLSRRAVRLESITVQKLLRGKSDEQLLRMPLMTDKNKQACLQILNLLFLSSLMGYPAYNPCISLRMVKLTMKYGASVFAASSFVNYGMFLIAAKHDIENAYRYGALGERFLDRFEAQEYMPRVRATFYGCIYAFRNPVKDVIGPLLEGYRVGVQTGDMEGAFLCMNLYFLNALEAGASITQIEREWEAFRESMVSSRYATFLKITMLHLQTLHHLSGKSKDPLAASGEYINFDEALSKAVKDKDALVHMALSMNRMIMAIHFNDLDLAVQHLGALKNLKQLPPGIKKITAAFYGGLVMIACIRAGRKPRVHRHYSRWIIKIMDYLATQTPHNCLDKLFLLEAEYASATGKNDVANKKYICAVGMAKDAGFPMYAALGYELWARHLYRVGDRIRSRTYFVESVRLNREVGIFRKVERLESEMSQLFPDFPDGGHEFTAHVGDHVSSSKLCCAESAVSQPDSETPSCSSS